MIAMPMTELCDMDREAKSKLAQELEFRKLLRVVGSWKSIATLYQDIECS
jgi:hypothetical protein